MYLTPDGRLWQTKIYIVYGSPGSGKTTYVKKHMLKGDIVIDLDNIKRAISLQDKTVTASSSILIMALDIREYMYTYIKSNKINDCCHIWVVSGLPKKAEREELKNRLKAKLIHIDTPYEKCIEQAMNDDDRKDKELQLKIIKKHFDDFEE